MYEKRCFESKCDEEKYLSTAKSLAVITLFCVTFFSKSPRARWLDQELRVDMHRCIKWTHRHRSHRDHSSSANKGNRNELL